jgi:hypothetical protein
MSRMIPAMTDQMGRYWNQPDPAAILIDDTHALMAAATFNQLAEYSGSLPTGVYAGKMWRRHDGIFDRNAKRRRWLLCWFGEVNDGKCEIEFREVLLADSSSDTQ